MNTDRQQLQDAEVRRSTRSYRVFLAWVGAELAAYAAAILLASDETPQGCTGLCFSDRGLLILVGMMFGLPTLAGQLIVGLLLTNRYNRRQLTPLATGTAAYFTTLTLAAAAFIVLAMTQW
jgi:hypothetical protein